ncbi:DUF202 domain-containing protein [Streptomyces sp. NPDC002851]
MSADPQPPVPARDPGLQPERTRLAWRRTTLACTVAAALGARVVLMGGTGPAQLAGAAVVLLLWVAFLALAQRRMRDLMSVRPGLLPVRMALGVAGCTVALAALAVFVVR